MHVLFSLSRSPVLPCTPATGAAAAAAAAFPVVSASPGTSPVASPGCFCLRFELLHQRAEFNPQVQVYLDCYSHVFKSSCC